MSVLDRFRLDGRTAILTGVGPGVGEHVAKAYAELGANVVISARSQDRLDRIAGEINALGGGRARAVAVDVANKGDLQKLVDSIVERLPQTLLVTRVAVFLASDEEASAPRHFELAASHGLTNLHASDLSGLDIRFLDFDRPGANSHIFLENPHHVLRLPEKQRQSASRLDLNYYLPCQVANREGGGTRTVAVIGLGRTGEGDYLSSEDMNDS